MIRKVELRDVKEIVEIYNYYILNSVATFEETRIDAEEMKNRIQFISSEFPWIVYEEEGKIIGYAYACQWKQRSAYRKTVESTVYVKQGKMKKGIGTALYGELINQLKDLDLHVIIGGIALPNHQSISLHEKFGFKKTAHFKEIGFKFNKWIDVGYWELLLG